MWNSHKKNISQLTPYGATLYFSIQKDVEEGEAVAEAEEDGAVEEEEVVEEEDKILLESAYLYGVKNDMRKSSWVKLV